MKILIVASEKDSTGAYHHFATSDIMDIHESLDSESSFWWIEHIRSKWFKQHNNNGCTLEFRTFVEVK